MSNDIFEVEARSNENQVYICRLECQESELQSTLDNHLIEKGQGWFMYEYKIIRYKRL